MFKQQCNVTTLLHAHSSADISSDPDTLRRKATIHQVTYILATSENVLIPGQNHLLTTGTDDPSLADTWAVIKVSGRQYRW